LARRKVSICKDRDTYGIILGYYWVSGGTDGNGKPLKAIRLAGKEHAMEVYHARVRSTKKHRDRMRRRK
jgi:hypothetical protein